MSVENTEPHVVIKRQAYKGNTTTPVNWTNKNAGRWEISFRGETAYGHVNVQESYKTIEEANKAYNLISAAYNYGRYNAGAYIAQMFTDIKNNIFSKY